MEINYLPLHASLKSSVLTLKCKMLFLKLYFQPIAMWQWYFLVKRCKYGYGIKLPTVFIFLFFTPKFKP